MMSVYIILLNLYFCLLHRWPKLPVPFERLGKPDANNKKSLKILLAHVRLRREVLRTRGSNFYVTEMLALTTQPSVTSSRSWQHISCRWDARSNHVTISDFTSPWKDINNFWSPIPLLKYMCISVFRCLYICSKCLIDASNIRNEHQRLMRLISWEQSTKDIRHFLPQ